MNAQSIKSFCWPSEKFYNKPICSLDFGENKRLHSKHKHVQPKLHRKFKKDEKLNLMHIAICRLLEPYGYYEFERFDDQGWPHYVVKENLPNLKAGEQSILMKDAIVNYFLQREFIN